MLEHNLDEFIDWAQAFIDQLSPREQRKLLQQIGRDVRAENQRSMQAQQAPDGSSWDARKPQDGKPNRRKMFKKLRQTKNFKIRTSREGLRVGFFGAIGRVAEIHHYGLREQLEHGPADYPARELIGLTAAQQQIIKDRIIHHLREAHS